MDWREILHRYLSAGVADSQAPPPLGQAEFINELGTASLRRRALQQRLHWDKRAASQQVPPVETYKVIEESPRRVVAEVEKSKLIGVYGNLRFLIEKFEDQWKLDDVLWKCTCTDGICFLCQGKGCCTLCDGRGYTRWFFGLFKEKCSVCNGEPQCTFCSGAGRCKYCLESEVPGWNSLMQIHADEKPIA